MVLNIMDENKILRLGAYWWVKFYDAFMPTDFDEDFSYFEISDFHAVSLKLHGATLIRTLEVTESYLEFETESQKTLFLLKWS